MLPQGKCDMSEVDKMAYYDLKTNEIWADSNIAGFHDEHIEIDEVIAPLIRELNIKGYKTKFCCSGHATLIYILPPSWDELKSRLSSTGIYTEEEVNALMEIAEEEISCANSYDYILVNDTISNTLSRFAQIIHSNRYSRNCMKEFLDSYIDGEVKPHVQSYKEALL